MIEFLNRFWWCVIRNLHADAPVALCIRDAPESVIDRGQTYAYVKPQWVPGLLRCERCHRLRARLFVRLPHNEN